MNNEKLFNTEVETVQDFKQHSLELLAARLHEQTYPGYPEFEQRYHGSELDSDILSPGTWESSSGQLPSPDERAAFLEKGMSLDSFGRPLHPWFEDMVTNPNIGVVTGKGFYWKWGPNYAADPIIIRNDLKEPCVLLIERCDGTGWALPGGFINENETGQEAAIREAKEETGIDLAKFNHSIKPVYEGPLSDLRITANAWPETSAYCFELDLNSKTDQKLLTEMMSANRRQKSIRSLGRFAFKQYFGHLPWKGGDDAKTAAWIPISELDDRLFGSHLLLIRQAIGK